MSDPQPVDYEPRPAVSPRAVSDDNAYLLPMAVFLGLVWVGGRWQSLYPAAYLARVAVVAALLWGLRRHYTKIRWNHAWLGALVGLAGIFEWVLVQKWLERHAALFRPSPDFFDPTKAFPNRAAFWSFIAVRVTGAVLVVPVMEELFWRDYVWRTVIAPNQFKLAEVGERDWKAYLTVSAAFAMVHGNWWLTAIGWALMVGALLIATRSLGACIVAHAVTNLLLAAYVLRYQEWSFW